LLNDPFFEHGLSADILLSYEQNEMSTAK
jgi:hypothetical protein